MQLDFDFTHLTPYEPAARIYCGMTDKNPDELLDVPHPLLEGVALKRPAWHFPAEHMVNLSRMLVAMRQAEEQKGVSDAAH